VPEVWVTEAVSATPLTVTPVAVMAPLASVALVVPS
jgi:hypothetical protein